MIRLYVSFRRLVQVRLVSYAYVAIEFLHVTFMVFSTLCGICGWLAAYKREFDQRLPARLFL